MTDINNINSLQDYRYYRDEVLRPYQNACITRNTLTTLALGVLTLSGLGISIYLGLHHSTSLPGACLITGFLGAMTFAGNVGRNMRREEAEALKKLVAPETIYTRLAGGDHADILEKLTREERETFFTYVQRQVKEPSVLHSFPQARDPEKVKLQKVLKTMAKDPSMLRRIQEIPGTNSMPFFVKAFWPVLKKNYNKAIPEQNETAVKLANFEDDQEWLSQHRSSS